MNATPTTREYCGSKSTAHVLFAFQVLYKDVMFYYEALKMLKLSDPVIELPAFQCSVFVLYRVMRPSKNCVVKVETEYHHDHELP